VGAILAVDAVGYSRLMGRDEEATLRRLHNYRGLIQSLATKHGGRVFGVAGDSEMAIFAEAGDAVRCALEIQEEIEKRDAILPKDSHMPVRIGINFGQVIVEDDSVFGDDVNIAARLETFAEAGEVCVSGAVFDRVKETSDWGFDSFGEERFKNISHPVRVYRVRTDPEAIGQVIPAKRRRPKPGRIWRAAAAASLIALLGATGWGVMVQVEKRRAEAEAASVIADAQSSVATAEAQIQRLLDNLRQSEKRATDERERVEALLASLQEIRSQADHKEQAALRQADEAQDLLTLLQASEARAEVERKHAETLLAALQEAEDQVMAAREAAEQERQARQDAERRAADQELMESLLASWRVAERQAAEERARTQALLTALQDAEARAEAERQASLDVESREVIQIQA
jgi:class 3 adenylate cyclase